MNSKRKNEDEKPKKVKDMNRSEFEAWVKSNEERDKRLQRESEASFIAGFVKLYHEEPPDKRLADYRDCFSNEDFDALVSLLEDSDEKVEDYTDPMEDVVAQAEEDIGIEETIEEQEKEPVADFSGKTASEIATHIMDKGLRINEVAAINKALEEDMERREAEHQERIKTDWLKFKVHAVDCEFSTDITEANNYEGRLFTRMECVADSRSMLRRVYNEASDMMSAGKLRAAALEEICDFAEDRFSVEILRAKKELSGSQAKELERLLDINLFREEVERKLLSISIPQLRSFNDYFRLVEFDSINGDFDTDIGERIIGLFNCVTKSWTYSAYDAYHEIQSDFIKATEKYAEMATKKAAVSALKKRMERTQEIKRESQSADA